MDSNFTFKYVHSLVDGPLTVYFNLHVDTHRIRVDAGDLFIIFADAIRSSQGILRGNITVDQDTLEIQGM